MSDSRVLATLADSAGPAPVAELARRCGLHPNSVRAHLRRLEEEGLAEHTNQLLGGRGRPRQMWQLTPRARPFGKPPMAYSELAEWLSTALTPSDAVEHGRRVGGERQAREAKSSAAAALQNSLSEMGFQPVREDRGQATRFTLRNCPYRDVARANPRVICALHRGIAEGVCEAADSGYTLTRFEVKPPEQAGCVIEIDRAEPERKEMSR